MRQVAPLSDLVWEWQGPQLGASVFSIFMMQHWAFDLGEIWRPVADLVGKWGAWPGQRATATWQITYVNNKRNVTETCRTRKTNTREIYHNTVYINCTYNKYIYYIYIERERERQRDRERGVYRETERKRGTYLQLMNVYLYADKLKTQRSLVTWRWLEAWAYPQRPPNSQWK